MRSFYEILGVPQGAAQEDIKHAYRHLVRKLHPDVSGGDTSLALRQVIQAYETLSNENRRRSYDQGLASWRRVVAPAEDHRAWFADEVAIDFPSIADVVSRIRESFLGWEGEAGDEALRADILLSRREAVFGVTVPLDVPVRSLCPMCGGRGESWMEPCDGCGGTGAWQLPHRVELCVPAGVSDGTRFRFTVTGAHTPPTRVEVRVAVR
jgi:molecular chaperone DnaJ